MTTPARADKVRLIGVGGVRQVSESSFELLLSEMTHYFAQQLATNTHTSDSKSDNDSDNASHQRKLLVDKLELIGFNVGYRLCERYTKDIPWLAEQLDCIKFLCKEFWLTIFQKQIDKLQTNNKGMYVLHDNHFKLLKHFVSVNSLSGDVLLEQARVYVSFSAGMIRGALNNLGVAASVKAEVISLPAIQFTINDIERARRAQDTPTQSSPPAPAPATAPSTAQS